MKKLILTFALVAGFMTVQAQDAPKSNTDKDQTEETISEEADSTTTSPSLNSGSSTGATPGSATDQNQQTVPATEADTTNQDRKPEEE